jgi:DNA-binding MarR family transcriptional regulator
VTQVKKSKATQTKKSAAKIPANGKAVPECSQPYALPPPHAEVKVHPELADHFGYCFIKASLRLRSRVNIALDKIGICGIHMSVLALLQARGTTTQSQLGESMGVDKATMVKLIDELEALRMVVRVVHSEDRRSRILQVTTRGSSALERATAISHEVIADFLSPLSSEDQATLRRTIPMLLGFSTIE